MSILRLREIESVTLSRSAENAETRRVMRVILQIVGACASSGCWPLRSWRLRLSRPLKPSCPI
ncbi:hypothetical protein BCY82_24205 [Klebsiella quasipneumoniae]|nr:hypothetical protein BCY82_24205 [Klebsiella quasipneumoniae]